MVNDWKAQFLAAAPQAFEKGASSSGEAERVAELEQMVGKLTMQFNTRAKIKGQGEEGGQPVSLRKLRKADTNFGQAGSSSRRM